MCAADDGAILAGRSAWRVPEPARPRPADSDTGGFDAARRVDPAGRSDQDLPGGRPARAGGPQPGRGGRGGGGGHGPLGQREVHTAQPRRGPGPAHERHDHRGRTADRQPQRERPGPVPGPARGDHLPVLQPARRSHRAGQRAAARPAGRRVPANRADPGRGAAGADGHRAEPGRLPGPAVRGTAAAGGDRAGAGELPDLLLADEPTGALDTATGLAIGRLLRELNADGQTLVLVTHDPALAERYAARTVRLLDGRLAAEVPA